MEIASAQWHYPHQDVAVWKCSMFSSCRPDRLPNLVCWTAAPVFDLPLLRSSRSSLPSLWHVPALPSARSYGQGVHLGLGHSQVSVSVIKNTSKLTAPSDRVMAAASPTVPHSVPVCSASGPDLKLIFEPNWPSCKGYILCMVAIFVKCSHFPNMTSFFEPFFA